MERKRGVQMDPDAYFTLIIYVLMVLTFVSLVLFFLYMIYRKEEETPAK